MISYQKGFTAECGLSLLFFLLLTRLASPDRLANLSPAIASEQRIAALEPPPLAAILDIPYVSGGGHKQQLDLYLPDTTGFPTVLFIHGGSLTGGDRRDEPHADICGTLRSLGIACAAMSYRLAPEYRWPAQPEDVVAAFAWVRENMAKHGGDPGAIYLFGHSSGCALPRS